MFKKYSILRKQERKTEIVKKIAQTTRRVNKIEFILFLICFPASTCLFLIPILFVYLFWFKSNQGSN